MTITKAFLEEQQKSLTQQREQMVAGIQQISGALELVQVLIRKIDAPEPLVTEPA